MRETDTAFEIRSIWHTIRSILHSLVAFAQASTVAQRVQHPSPCFIPSHTLPHANLAQTAAPARADKSSRRQLATQHQRLQTRGTRRCSHTLRRKKLHSCWCGLDRSSDQARGHNSATAPKRELQSRLGSLAEVVVASAAARVVGTTCFQGTLVVALVGSRSQSWLVGWRAFPQPHPDSRVQGCCTRSHRER